MKHESNMLLDVRDRGAALDYDFGVTRFFGTSDIGTRGLISGWAAPEQMHVWNDGLDAQFFVRMDPPEQACRLTVEAVPFVTRRQPSQDVTLYVNGLRLGFWRLQRAEPHIVEAILEPEVWLRRSNEGVIRCNWHVPNSVRPSEIGEGPDYRTLGLCLRTFAIGNL